MANRYDVLKKMYMREGGDVNPNAAVDSLTTGEQSDNSRFPITDLDKKPLMEELKAYIEDAYLKWEKLVSVDVFVKDHYYIATNLETFFRTIFEKAGQIYDIVIRNISALPNAVKQDNFWEIVKKNFGEVGRNVEKLVLDVMDQFVDISNANAGIMKIGASLIGLGLVMLAYNYYQADSVNMEGAKLLRAGRYPFKEFKVYKLGVSYMKEGFSGVSPMLDDFINVLKRTMLSFYDMFVKTVSDNKIAMAGYAFIALGTGCIVYPILSTDYSALPASTMSKDIPLNMRKADLTYA